MVTYPKMLLNITLSCGCTASRTIDYRDPRPELREEWSCTAHGKVEVEKWVGRGK